MPSSGKSDCEEPPKRELDNTLELIACNDIVFILEWTEKKWYIRCFNQIDMDSGYEYV